MKKRGFTLVEIIITISLLTVVVAPIVTAFMVGMKSTDNIQKDFNMEVLAEELMNEIMSRDYEDRINYGSIGKEDGEINRRDFDDIDDYDGFFEDYGAISDISGDIQDQYSDYKRKVEIYNANGQRISAADGLEFVPEKLAYFPDVLTNITLSRDGNRMFAVNNSNKALIVANPFSGTIETQVTLPDLPLNIATTPDSKIIYVNYGDNMEVYSYSLGELNLIRTFSGEALQGIEDMCFIDGKFATAGVNGLYVDFEKIGDYTDCYFLYTLQGKTVLGYSDKVAILENTDLTSSIYEFSLPSSKLTSAYYDVFNNEFVFTTSGDYVYKYDVDGDALSNQVSLEYEKLESIVYSYIDDEYYFGGKEGDSNKFFKTDGGYLGVADLINNGSVIDMDFLEDSGEIVYLGQNTINFYSLKTKSTTSYNKPININDDLIDLKVTNKYIYILATDGLYRFHRGDITDYRYFAKNGIRNFAVNNQEVLFSDGTLLYSLSSELTDLKTFNYFSGIDNILCSKDGKTLFMFSKTNSKIYFLDTFTNNISDMDYDAIASTLSASGNTLITSKDNGDVDFIYSKNIDSNSTEDVYKNLCNIDKEDRFVAFSDTEKKIDIYSYQDKFEDEFDDFNGYSFASYSTGANEGFQIEQDSGKIEVNTKPIIGSDDNSNLCSVLFYRTFVFPIPKYLRTFSVDAQIENVQGNIQFFCYNGIISKSLLDQTSGTLSDAPVKTDIVATGNFTDTYNVPPSNVLSIGFRLDDSDTNDFASLTLDSLKIRFNQDTVFTKEFTKSTDFNSITDWKTSWDNKFLYIASGNTLYTYDIDKKDFVQRKNVTIPDVTQIYKIEVSKDNNTIFAATDNGMYSIKEPVRTKIIKVIVENKDQKVDEYVLTSSMSNWKTEHTTRVIPHLVAREFVFTTNEYNGEIDEDTVWTSDRQYVIEDDLVVKTGKKLIIQDDTILKFDTGARIKLEDGSFLYAKGTVFTSLKDNTFGACMNPSGGAPASGDYAGIDLDEGASISAQNCEFYYASNAIIKHGNSFLDVRDSIFSKNLTSISLTGTFDDVTIEGNIFKANENDLVLNTFTGKIENNIFTGTVVRSIDLNNCPQVELSSNMFSNIPGDVIYTNAGELDVTYNDFASCDNVLEATEADIRFSDNNINDCDYFFDISDYMTSGPKDLNIMNNIFSGCDSVLSLSGSLPNLSINTKLNYFVRCVNEVTNTSSKVADCKYNYWGENTSKSFTNTITEPYVLFGRIDQPRSYEGESVIRHHLRINSSGSANFKDGRLYLFSEFIKPFIEIRKSTGGDAASFSADSMIIDQDTSEVASIFTDTGLQPQSQWEGFRVYGDINLKYSVVDKADCIFAMRSQSMINEENYGPRLQEIVYNRFGEENGYCFGFYASEAGNEFNAVSNMMSFNIFEKESDYIDPNSYIPVPLSDPFDWRYNYWGDNNIVNTPDGAVAAVVNVFPRAVMGSIDSAITVPYYPATNEHRLVCLGDIEVNSQVRFANSGSAMGIVTPQVVMTGDDGIKISSAGSITVQTAHPYAEFNDIRVLDSKFSSYKNWERWGGIDPDTDPENLPIGIYSMQPKMKFSIKNANLVWENIVKNNTVNGVLQFEDCFMMVSDNSVINTDYNGIYFQIKDSIIGFKNSAMFRMSQLNSLSSFEFTDNKIGPYNSTFFVDGIKLENGNTTPSKYFGLNGTSSDSPSMVEFTDNEFYRSGGIYFDFVPQNIEILNNTFEKCYGVDHIFYLKYGSCNLLIEGNEFGDISGFDPDADKACGGFLKIDTLTLNNANINNNTFADSLGAVSPFEISNVVVDDPFIIEGNEFIYSGNNDKLFKVYNTSELSSDGVPDSFIFKNNLFYKPENGSDFYIIDGNNLNELAFYFNHSNSEYAFNLNGSSDLIVITNNNFKGFDGSVNTINTSVICNYIENPPFSVSINPLSLPDPVDISTSADFQVKTYDTSEIYGMDVYQDPNYIQKDKDVQFTLITDPGATQFDFGVFNSFFSGPSLDNSIGAFLVRHYMTPASAQVNFLSSPKQKGYFILTRPAGTDEYNGTFTINGYSNSTTDYNYINADWNDLIKVSIPVFGLINGISEFPVPMPMPDPPEPPLDFEFTSIDCPVNGHDFDGFVTLEWEHNVDAYHPIFYYTLVIMKKLTAGGWVQALYLTLPGTVTSYTTTQKLDYGSYVVRIYAYNNAPFEHTENSQNPAIIGDSDSGVAFDATDVFHVEKPPRVIGPDYYTENELISGSKFIEMDLIPGANTYRLEYAKYTIGFDSSEVGVWEENISNNNHVALTNLNNVTAGLYIYRSRAGFKSGDIEEYTEYGPERFILVKNGNTGKTIAVLVSDRSVLWRPGMKNIVAFGDDNWTAPLPTAAIATPYEQLFAPLKHLKQDAEIKDLQNAVILRVADPINLPISKTDYDNVTDMIKQGLNNNSIEDPGCIDINPYDPKDYKSVLENIDVLLVNANYTTNESIFYNLLVSNKKWSILTSDAPFIENGGILKNWFCSEMRTGSTYSGLHLVRAMPSEGYPSPSNAMYVNKSNVSGGLPFKTVFQTETFGNIVDVHDNMTLPEVIHNVKTGATTPTYYPSRRLLIAYEHAVGTDKKRNVFINQKAFMKKSRAYYHEGSYTLTMNDVLNKCIKYVLFVDPPIPSDFDLTYKDYDSKGRFNIRDYYGGTYNSSDPTLPIFMDLDGNPTNNENSHYTPMLEWTRDKNVDNYMIESTCPTKVSGDPPVVNLGFTNSYNLGKYFNIAVNPNISGELMFTFVAENSTGRKEIDFRIRYAGKSLAAISDGEWPGIAAGGGLTPILNSNPKDNGARASVMRLEVEDDSGTLIHEKNYDINSTTDQFDPVVLEPIMGTAAYDNIGNNNFKVRFGSKKPTSDAIRFLGYEMGPEVSGSFQIRPPVPLFDSPSYNVDVNSDGSNDFYEDWDGNYLIRLLPPINFTPPNPISYVLLGTPQGYTTPMNIALTPAPINEKDTTSLNSYFKVPGNITFYSQLLYNGAASSIVSHSVRIPPPPVLTTTDTELIPGIDNPLEITLDINYSGSALEGTPLQWDNVEIWWKRPGDSAFTLSRTRPRDGNLTYPFSGLNYGYYYFKARVLRGADDTSLFSNTVTVRKRRALVYSIYRNRSGNDWDGYKYKPSIQISSRDDQVEYQVDMTIGYWSGGWDSNWIESGSDSTSLDGATFGSGDVYNCGTYGTYASKREVYIRVQVIDKATSNVLLDTDFIEADSSNTIDY